MASMTRKDFLGVLARALGGALGVAALSSCSDAVGIITQPDAQRGDAAAAGCSDTNAATTIAENHTHGAHELVVPSGDVAAGADSPRACMNASSP